MKSEGGYYEFGRPLSIQRGCENNCRYCYAKHDCIFRHKRCQINEWIRPFVNQKLVDKRYGKYLKPIMFPSTHDITELNMSECVIVIKKLLAKGNTITIVSKPRWTVIPLIAEALIDWKEQITFRFTIGSTHDETLRFWEPGASGFEERLRCLQYCFCKGYKTSVNCEPYLDGLVHLVYEATAEFVNESFWIGVMKKFKPRVDRKAISRTDWNDFVRPMLAASTDKAVQAIYDTMKDKPFVVFKDSVRKIIGLEAK
jgi:DNA repair photolyase